MVYSSDMANYRTISVAMVDNSLVTNASEGTITFKYKLSFEYGSGTSKQTFINPSELTFTLGGFGNLQDVVNSMSTSFQIQAGKKAEIKNILPSSLTNEKLKELAKTEYMFQLKEVETTRITFGYNLEFFTYNDDEGQITISYRVNVAQTSQADAEKKIVFTLKPLFLMGFQHHKKLWIILV